MQHRRYTEIDALRGMAALVVLVYHLFDADRIGRPFIGGFDGWAELIPTTIFNGTGATVLFFVISGFVLAEGTRPSIDPRNVASFAVRRVFRIMPGVWASIALALFFGAAVAPGKWPSTLLLGDEATRLNGPLWSLQVEMIASAIFPFILYASVIGGVFAQAIILCALMYVEGTGASLPWSWLFVFAFQLGIMVRPASEAFGRLSRPLRTAVVIIAVAAIMVSTNFDRLHIIPMRAHILLAGLGSFGLVSYVVSGPSLLVDFLSRPIPQFFGRVSYSLYLFNILIIREISVAIAPFATHITDDWPFGRLLVQHLVNGIVCIPVCIAAAYLGWRFIEDPFHRVGRYLGRLITASKAAPSVVLGETYGTM